MTPLLAGLSAVAAVIAAGALPVVRSRRWPGAASLERSWSRLSSVGRARRASHHMGDELAVFLEEVARALRSGASMRVSIVSGTSHTSGPLRTDLDLLVARLDAGIALDDGVREWMDRRADVRLVQVVGAAILLAARVGGSMAQAVDGVADTVRSELAVQAEVRALAAQARASAVLVAALPVGFASVAGVLDSRSVTFLLGTSVGALCLGGGVLLNAAGFVWMRRISRSVS